MMFVVSLWIFYRDGTGRVSVSCRSLRSQRSTDRFIRLISTHAATKSDLMESCDANSFQLLKGQPTFLSVHAFPYTTAIALCVYATYLQVQAAFPGNYRVALIFCVTTAISILVACVPPYMFPTPALPSALEVMFTVAGNMVFEDDLPNERETTKKRLGYLVVAVLLYGFVATLSAALDSEVKSSDWFFFFSFAILVGHGIYLHPRLLQSDGPGYPRATLMFCLLGFLTFHALVVINIRNGFKAISRYSFRFVFLIGILRQVDRVLRFLGMPPLQGNDAPASPALADGEQRNNAPADGQ